MRDAPWRQPGIPAPAHQDATGPWWEIPELPHWWVRPRSWLYEGAQGYEARHKHGYLADVHAPSMYLLGIFAYQSQMHYVIRRREMSAA